MLSCRTIKFLHFLPLSCPNDFFLPFCVFCSPRNYVSKAAPSSHTYSETPFPVVQALTLHALFNILDSQWTWSVWCCVRSRRPPRLVCTSCFPVTWSAPSSRSRAWAFCPSLALGCWRTPPPGSGSLRLGGSLVCGPISCNRRGWPGEGASFCS